MIPKDMSRYPGHDKVDDATLLGILSGRYRAGAFLTSRPPVEVIALPSGDWTPFEILEKSPDHKGRIFVTGELSSGEIFKTPAFLISVFWWLSLSDVANSLIQKLQTVVVNSMTSHDPEKDRRQLPDAFPDGSYVVHPIGPLEVPVADLWIYEPGEDEADEPQEQTISPSFSDSRLEIIAREWADVFNPKTQSPSRTKMAEILASRNIPELGGIRLERIKQLIKDCAPPPGWKPNTTRQGKSK